MSAYLPELTALELPELVAQMIVVRASGFLWDHQIRYPQWEPPAQTLRYWVETLGVGGVILLGGSAAELTLRTQQLQDWAKIPLLLAADVEEGVGQRFPGGTWFPPPMALAAIAQHDLSQAVQLSEQMGAAIAQEAQAIGLNWVLAPVVDVNNNPANPVINVRAFGETADQVSQLAVAFIKGVKRLPVLTVAKHFPGHGDTTVDSHLELPVIPHSLDRLQQVELLPFQAAIAAGVDAVMSAHLQIPALDAIYPATLSDRVLTRLLRQTLEFKGLTVTDALVMGAIAHQYGANEAVVLAVEAGADIVLMPADPEAAISAICQAVEEGRVPLEQIYQSVERIWRAKQTVCAPDVQGETSHAWERIVPAIQPQTLIDRLAQPTAIAIRDTILQQSLTVHRPSAFQFATPATGTPHRNLILIDTALNSKEVGLHTPAITLPAKYGYQLQVIDGHTPPLSPSDSPAMPTLVQLFSRGNPFRGRAELTQTAQTWIEFLVETQQLQALVVYGSPYLLEPVRSMLTPAMPYVFTYGQMPQAQAIALEALFENL